MAPKKSSTPIKPSEGSTMTHEDEETQHEIVLMMDPRWDSKRRHSFSSNVDNPGSFLKNDHHMSLKTKIYTLLKI